MDGDGKGTIGDKSRHGKRSEVRHNMNNKTTFIDEYIN